MRRIIYRSVASADLDRVEMFRLLYHARVANEARGLTGVLLRADRHLLQVLEGPVWRVMQTFELIRHDIRHTGIDVIDERSITQATYPACPMRYFDDHHIAQALGFLQRETAGPVPPPIAEAVRDFYVDTFVQAGRVTPGLAEAAPPSSATPY